MLQILWRASANAGPRSPQIHLSETTAGRRCNQEWSRAEQYFLDPLNQSEQIARQDHLVTYRTTANSLSLTVLGRKNAARFSRKSPGAKKSGPRSLVPNAECTRL